MLYANNSDVTNIELEIKQESQKSLLKLLNAEKRLIAKIGERRVDQLRMFSQKGLTSAEEERFKKGLDHDDKKLTWIWLRLKRIQHTIDRSQQRRHASTNR
jgi:hypothetical protein